MRLILAFLLTFALCADAGSLRHRRLRMTTAPNNVHGCVARWTPRVVVAATGTWSDATGRGHNLTLSGSATVTSEGLSILNSSPISYAHAPYAVDLAPASVTIAAWVRWDEATNNNVVVGLFTPTPSTLLCAYDINQTPVSGSNYGLQGLYNYNSGWRWVGSNATSMANTGVWYHVALVLYPAGSSGTVYRNGSADNGSSSGSVGPAISYDSSMRLYVGSHDSASTSLAKTITDIRIYGRALTATEIARIYAAGR